MTATIASSSANSAPWATKFQFITLAGFHALNYSMFELAYRLRPQTTWTASSNCQQKRNFGAGRKKASTRGQAPAPRSGHQLLLTM